MWSGMRYTTTQRAKRSCARSPDNVQQGDERGRRIIKVIGMILIVWGIVGIIMGTMMFGDIGIACIVGAVTALLSGFGFLSVNKELVKIRRADP